MRLTYQVIVDKNLKAKRFQDVELPVEIDSSRLTVLCDIVSLLRASFEMSPVIRPRFQKPYIRTGNADVQV